MTAELILRTANDTVDEANGTVEATVLPGTGYRVGSTSSDSVTVEDDDLPAAPTGLHANGHLVDGKITLRWNPVPGATGYEVRYAEEVCVRASRPGRPDDAVCGLGDPPMWSTITADGITTEEITIDGAAVLQTTLKLTPPDPLRSKRCYNRLGFDLSDVTPSCIPWPLYHVEVQAIIVDASDWSDFALIFPTSEPNRSSDANVFYDYRVATNEFRPKYQPERNGSHEYGYTLCRGTITTDVAWSWSTNEQGELLRDDDTVTAIAAATEAAIEEWGTSVRWVANGANIISTTATETEMCADSDSNPIRIHSRCRRRGAV